MYPDDGLFDEDEGELDTYFCPLLPMTRLASARWPRQTPSARTSHLRLWQHQVSAWVRRLPAPPLVFSLDSRSPFRFFDLRAFAPHVDLLNDVGSAVELSFPSLRVFGFRSSSTVVAGSAPAASVAGVTSYLYVSQYFSSFQRPGLAFLPLVADSGIAFFSRVFFMAGAASGLYFFLHSLKTSRRR